MFNKAVGSANWIPPGDPGFCRDHITIPKLYRWKGEDRLLSFPELFALRLFHATATFTDNYTNLVCDRAFEDLGLDVVENSGDEVLDLALDLFDHVDGIRPSAEGLELQREYARRYWSQFDRFPILAKHKGMVSARFLIRHQGLFTCSDADLRETERKAAHFFKDAWAPQG